MPTELAYLCLSSWHTYAHALGTKDPPPGRELRFVRRVVEVMPRILLDEILVSRPQDIAVAHGELQHQRRPICLEFCIQAGSTGLSRARIGIILLVVAFIFSFIAPCMIHGKEA